jgi:hypothetical protein
MECSTCGLQVKTIAAIKKCGLKVAAKPDEQCVFRDHQPELTGGAKYAFVDGKHRVLVDAAMFAAMVDAPLGMLDLSLFGDAVCPGERVVLVCDGKTAEFVVTGVAAVCEPVMGG